MTAFDPIVQEVDREAAFALKQAIVPEDARSFAERVQDTFEDIRQTISENSDRLADAADRAAIQTRDAYDKASSRARAVAAELDPLVRKEPYLALAAGICVGLLVGMLIAGRGPKIVYIRPPRA